MSFDWRTEEDGAPPWEAPAPRPSRQRNGRPLLAVLLLVVIGGASLYYLYRQANERISATEAAVTDEVLASHQLVELAAEAEDPELLRSVLSGADEEWARAQARRIEDGLAGHARFGLAPVGGNGEMPAVTLDPEMRSAELTWAARFVVTDSAGITQTVTLTQTAVYRRGTDNWLFAPPLPDFWGGTDEYRGDYLEAIFAERDETLARRLAGDLDGFLAGLCSSRSCPAGFELRLILSTDPASFDALDPGSLMVAGRTVSLPTPTLVGLPVDEPGYTALLRGYAILLSTAVLGDLADYGCCRGELYAAGWLELQQHQLGLLPWPLDREAYERLVLQLPTLTDYSALLRSDVPDRSGLSFAEWAPVYAFAEFLEESFHPLLAANAVNTPYARLLEQAGVSTRAWTSAFTRYIYDQSASGQVAEAPLPLPEADMALRCEDSEDNVALRQLDLQSGQWQTLYQEQYRPAESPLNYSYAEPLGRGNGLAIISRQVVVRTRAQESVSFSIQVAHEGITTTLMSTNAATWDELPQTYPSGVDPLGRYLVVGDYSPQRGTSAAEYRFSLVELDGCDGESCPLVPLPGAVQWAPNGAATLVAGHSPQVGEVGAAPPELYVGDAKAENLVLLGHAKPATWLDSTRYAYVTTVMEGVPQPAIVVRALPDHAEVGRIPLSNLWPLAGETDPALPDGAVLDARMLLTRPGDPHTMLVDVADDVSGSRATATRFLVRFSEDWSDIANSRLLGGASRLGHFSASGRWLMEQSYNNPQAPSTLIDLAGWPGTATSWRQFEPSYQIRPWAPSGDWLPLNGETHMLLYNPSADYSYFVPFEDRSCYFYTWLEEEG